MGSHHLFQTQAGGLYWNIGFAYNICFKNSLISEDYVAFIFYYKSKDSMSFNFNDIRKIRDDHHQSSLLAV